MVTRIPSWRPAVLRLAVGPLMAITGTDRLELTSQANPTIFAQISLPGIAMAGTAWVLLVAQVAIGRARSRGTGVDGLRLRVHAWRPRRGLAYRCSYARCSRVGLAATGDADDV